jgi:hypothetical protein
MFEALQRLRQSANAAAVPAIDPAREAALLAAFDAHQWNRNRSRRSFAFPAWAAAAALIVTTVSLNWLVVARPLSQPADGRRGWPANATVATPSDFYTNNFDGFVAWPGASAWPPLESGALMRVDLPVSLLPTLGLSAPSSAAGLVAADIVVGQDGLARAVRLVQQP